MKLVKERDFFRRIVYANIIYLASSAHNARREPLRHDPPSGVGSVPLLEIRCIAVAIKMQRIKKPYDLNVNILKPLRID